MMKAGALQNPYNHKVSVRTSSVSKIKFSVFLKTDNPMFMQNIGYRNTQMFSL
jgi:hypothetical protein